MSKPLVSGLGVLVLVCGCILMSACARPPERTGKPADQTGTPPPSAGTIPPPLPPGRTPSGGGIR